MRRILFITNGHGEDLVAAEIIKKFGREAAPTVFPVVGEGKIFESLNIQVLGPKRKLPSGGFSLRNLFYLAQDIYAGLTKDTLEKIRILRGLRGNFDLVVAIGDIVPIIGALMVKAPFIFVGVNKSSYYKWFGFNYTPWEKLLLQKHALKVFVRDKATERSLKSYGVKIPSAEYAGNPLMDCIGKIPTKVGEGVRIGFLPGTRADAYLNLQDFRKVAKEIMLLKNPDLNLKFLIATNLENIPEYMENKPFAEVLAQSDLIIGLSGTGNEQAAGCGIPVVSFYGRGSQYNKKFAKAQKQLLGESLSLVCDPDPIPVTAEILHLLRNPAKREKMGKVGRERMGESGAVEKIAAYIREI